MKKCTTFLSILKQLITEEDITTIIKQHNYIDTARKFTVLSLLEFFATASTNEWKSFRHGADIAKQHGLISADYSTISKKASDVPYAIFKDLFVLLCSRCNRGMRRAISFPQDLLLVDSTTITVGKNRLTWAPYHGEKAGVKLHTALPLSSKIPTTIKESKGLQHDSPILDEFVDSSFILVTDRAYFNIDRCDYFATAKQGFVTRIKTNVEISYKKSLKRLVDPHSNVIADYTCKLGTKQKRSSKRHRVVEFIDYEGKLIRVVTNLYSVSAQTIAAIYKARWAVEVFFRWIKQHLNVSRLFGTTANSVFNQLYAALLTYVILRFTHSYISKKVRYEKLSFISFTRRLLYTNLPMEWIAHIQYIRH